MQQQQQQDSDAPLERLLVVHLKLAQLCTGRDLGESATLDECEEQILYYYHHRHQNTNIVAATEAAAQSHQQEAVQFLGLCSALYSLPRTLKSYCDIQDNDEESGDQTQEVQLDQSTLVFIPLFEATCRGNEGGRTQQPILLCVAQISRRKSSGQNSHTKGGNPPAIRKSIERWHQLFCLLHGGGIHARLSSSANSNATAPKSVTKATGDCPYPGMDQLFDGLKMLRRLEETIGRSPAPDMDLVLEHESLREELQQFRKTLPVASLRDTLQLHYNAYIEDFALLSKKNGGAGRCLVDLVPAPIPLADGSHALQSLPEKPPPHVSSHLSQALRAMLSETSTTNTDEEQKPELLAISTFHRGQSLYHHRKDGQCDEDNPSFSLLMWYLASFTFKIKEQQQSQQAFAAAAPPRRISHALVSFSDHVSVSGDANVSHEDQQTQGSNEFLGSFLCTPPLAMLSTSEQTTPQVLGPRGENVWAPLVHYSSCRILEATPKSEPECVHCIRYEWKDFSFLFFVSPADGNNSLALQSKALDHSQSYDSIYDDDDGMTTLLGSISTALVDALTVAAAQTHPLERYTPDSNLASLRSPGRDIVFIDQSSCESIIMPRPSHETLRSDSAPTSPRRFLQSFWSTPLIGPQKKKKSSRKADPDQESRAWAAAGLDCRHWLVSHLSQATVLAFDDAINEVSCYRQQRSEGITDGEYELLSTVDGGWVYAYADQQDRELYIYLDSRDYVTIADAEKGIQEVRAAVLHDTVL